jgi:predicted nucleic acid-binding protein
MILVDTSVWIQHFRRREPALADYLSDGLVLIHPFVSGELACGTLKDRAATLSDLHALPAAQPASNTEVLRLIESSRLWGRGLGWIDMHLLASAMLSHCGFWTRDKRLGEAATKMGLRHAPSTTR